MAVILILLLAVPACFPATGAEEQGITLAFHPTPGQVFIQRENITLSMEMDLEEPDEDEDLEEEAQGLSGLLSTIDTRLGAITRVDVRGIDADGRAELGLTFVSLLADMSLSGMSLTTRLDTTDPVTLPPGQYASLAAMIGDGYAVRVDPFGIPVRVEGWDELIERVAERLGLKESDREELRDNLEQARVPEDGFPSGSVARPYPSAPVHIGDSWQSVGSTYANGILLLMENTYTLTARRQGMAVIEVRSVMESVKAPVRTVSADDTIETVLKGRQAGVIEIREADGWITKADIKQELRGMMTAAMPQTNKALTVDLTLRGTYSLVSTPK